MKKKCMAVILAAALLLAGCGNTDSTPKEDNSAKTTAEVQTANEEEVSSESGSEDVKAMGRYVETEQDISELSSNAVRFSQMEDGTLYICDGTGSIYVSTDEGQNWSPYIIESFEQFMEEKDNCWFSDMEMAADGSLLGITNASDNPEEWIPELIHFPKDGSMEVFSIPLTEEDMYVNKVWATKDNKIFVSTFGNSLYEINMDGTVEQKITLEIMSPDIIQFQDNLMVMDGYGKDELLIYDLSTNSYVEDDVLNNFMKENYPGRSSNGNQYQVYEFFGNDGALYIAGKKGLHRHVIGGSTMEEVIDGTLSVLSNPNKWVVGMVALSDNQFLLLHAGGTLVHFTYDPSISAVPENQITIYSLRQQDQLLSAISAYQSRHSDTYVKYEIGMEEGSSMTREDALKNLNTKILAGEGPDVLILDELPMDSFMEKGLLVEISDLVSEINKQEPLYMNLVDGLRMNGNLYTIPALVEFPIIAGENLYVNNMTNLATMAEEIEELRATQPSGDIFQTYTPKGVMRIFTAANAPAWKTEKGDLNKDAIKNFWEQTKKIYDAQMAGASEDKIAQYEQTQVMYEQEYGLSYEDSTWFDYLYCMNYIGGNVKLLVGKDSIPYQQAELYSLPKNDRGENVAVRSMDGEAGKVYVPKLMMGINASSNHEEAAKGFISEMLSSEIQKSMEGFSVNKTALENSFIPDPQTYVEGQPMYSAGSTNVETGQEIYEEVWWPVGEDMTPFYDMVENAAVPYLKDNVLEAAVFDAGTSYFEGESTLEEAMNELESQVALYMAE